MGYLHIIFFFTWDIESKALEQINALVSGLDPLPLTSLSSKYPKSFYWYMRCRTALLSCDRGSHSGSLG